MRRLAALVFAACLLSTSLLAAQDGTSTVTIHVVQRGENLYQIAQLYGMDWQELARLNGLQDPSSLDVGQRLLVPAVSVSPSGSSLVHVVQPGETLESIAAYYGLSLDALQAMNELSSADLFVGQAVIIALPPQQTPTTAGTAIAANQPPEAMLHTVAAGETLFRIAMQYGSTVYEIASANGIADPEIIYPGQRLIIPGVQAPVITANLPAPLTGLQITPIVLVEGQSGAFRFTSSAPVSISGQFLERTVPFATDTGTGEQIGLVGVPFGTSEGIYPAQFTFTDGAGQTQSLTANIQVVSGAYQTDDDIQVVGDSDLLLDPAVEQAELDVVSAYMSAFTTDRLYNGIFGLPAAATITSGFGNTRSYNGGTIMRVHTGTDFGGAPGTPIMAAADGRVVMVAPLDIRGNATIIDHGWGVYTGYWHQSEQYVQPGDLVQAGQVIGAIGATGRVSGPHLHWELWVNGVPVDPMQWTVMSFD